MKKRIKVVFPRMETLQFHNAYDGGSKFVHYLSEELVKRGFDVEIVSTIPPKNPKLRKTKHNGVKYRFLQVKYTGKKRRINLLQKFIFSYKLSRYLEKIEFDILHSTEMFSYFYLHKKERKPVVFQCWVLEPWYGNEALKQKGLGKIYVKFFLRKAWQYCIEHSDSVAADAKFQIPRLEKIGVPLNKVWFIPNGVIYKKIREYSKNYKNQRKSLGIDSKDFVVLSVCQIAPDKGIDDIINGFEIAKKSAKNLKLILIGRGPLEEEMKKLVKEKKLEKEVFFLKNLQEEVLYDYFFNADLFISAVISEDFMISIQEGMSAGLPIVSSAQPFLVKNGINGYVVGFENPQGISEGILKIYSLSKEKRKKMGENSRKMAEEYDYGNLVKLAIKEYKSLVK